MLKAWRRRLRRRFIVLGCGFALVAIGANVAAAYAHAGTWAAGMVTGCLMTAFVAIRLSPPAHIEQWEVGAWGEEWTAKALRKLDRHTWRVLHDLDSAHGNFDHVVVGPPGVFVIDSKNWNGEVTIDGDTAHLRRIENPDSLYVFERLPKQMRGYAAELSDKLQTDGLRLGWVTPVVAIWARFPEKVTGNSNLTYVHGDSLVAWLCDQQPRLRLDQIESAASALLPPRKSRLGRAVAKLRLADG
jgi:hypothetical protein